MKKITIFQIFFIFLILLTFLSGCTQDNSNENVFNMNAQELIDDHSFSSSMSGGEMKWVSDYKSLNEGDTLVLTDTISNITYISFFYNATTISFDADGNAGMGAPSNQIAFMFEGNLTEQYKIGDDVKITLTVKHFVYENETTGIGLDMDVFEEGWDQEEFISNFYSQTLPESCIEKL